MKRNNSYLSNNSKRNTCLIYTFYNVFLHCFLEWSVFANGILKLEYNHESTAYLQTLRLFLPG